MSTPCIITVAITGSVPQKSDNPAVPITINEQIESTHAAFEAGATIAHLHVRKDDGSVDWDREGSDSRNQLLQLRGFELQHLPDCRHGVLNVEYEPMVP